MTVRLYGHSRGTSSFVQVTAGLERALRLNNALAGVYYIDAEEQYDDDGPPTGVDAPIALHCGSPLATSVSHQQGAHRRHWLLLAPNSLGVPEPLRQSLETTIAISRQHGICRSPVLNGLLAPSFWAAEVLSSCFKLPVALAPHGIDPDVYVESDHDRGVLDRLYRREEFRVLHLTSSLLQRKGTDQLMLAWKNAREAGWLPESATLVIVANALAINEHTLRLMELGLGAEANVRVMANANLSSPEFAAALRTAHLVCQPSSAEGFGLVPLEARACGVPVAATTCTGHAEHMGECDEMDGIVTIESGPIGPSDDYPGARAPTVASEAIAEALRVAYERWTDLSLAAQIRAPQVRARWAWETVMAEAIERLTREAI